MRHLPVFSTIGQALGVFGLHIGKIFLWSLIPIGLTLAVVAALFGMAFLAGVDFQAYSRGFAPWMLGAIPAVAMIVIIWIPYNMRVNQITVTGAVEPGGYMGKIFSSASLRYLGYAVLVGLITLGGLLASCLPVILANVSGSQGLFAAASAVTLALMVTFFILIAPLHLIMPAAALERDPSLGKAYSLGAHCKLRLFACMALTMILFGLLGALISLPAEFMGEGAAMIYNLIAIPVQIILHFFSYVTSLAVPAVAYRILHGLPDPRELDFQWPAQPQPGDGQGGGI